MASAAQLNSRRIASVIPISEARRLQEDPWALCLTRVASADRDAFARLFEHFAPQIRAFGLSTVIPDRSGQFADELVQEVMIAVWNKAAHYDAGKAGAATWIFAIARNKRIDLLRKLKRQEPAVDIDEIWPLVDDGPGPEELLGRHGIEQRVRSSLKDLPETQRQVLVMAYMEGKSHSEIAEDLALPLGTVKSRIRLAMQRLQLVFDGQDH